MPTTVLVARDLATRRGTHRLARGVTRDEQEGFAPAWTSGRRTRSPADGNVDHLSNRGKITRLEVALDGGDRSRLRSPRTSSSTSRRAWPGRRSVETGPVRARILRWANQTPDGSADRLRRLRPHLAAADRRGKAAGEPQRIDGRRRAGARIRAGRFAGRPVDRVRHLERRRRRSCLEDGSDRQAARRGKLTAHPGHYANPAWSPDGERLALIRGRVSSSAAASRRKSSSSTSAGCRGRRRRAVRRPP